ncbi:MAG: hypothetical protein M3Z50_14465, partial [Actinomycetota bacterium]|nr:hypothetical protein [Actinomycetota bacterium]
TVRAAVGVVAVLAAGQISSRVAAAAAAPAAVGPVSAVAASWTPSVTGTSSKVRQLVPCGGMMYAVGNFPGVKSAGGTTYSRPNAFSFRASSPGDVSAWNPMTNGVVNSVALSADCSTAYLGGAFTSVHGTAAKNIAKVSVATGAVDQAFARSASGQVATLYLYGSHLLTGGYFTSINGSSRRYFASLNAATGRDDGYLNLNISGNYQFPGVKPNPSRVWNTEVSHGGSQLLVMGDFTSVGGKHREQIFMLDLASATVTDWTSNEFYQPCATVEPFYLQAASWSPDDSKVYVATTGYKPYNLPKTAPRSGLCDAAAAFPATRATVSRLWINYTGCDSLFSTTADASTVYIGGHERWANNPHGCDNPGPGALARPGVGGLSPVTGAATNWNPTRSRGQGADDLVITAAGLWVASDTFFGSTFCANRYHAGICLLPY